jgi:hypothetical protein
MSSRTPGTAVVALLLALTAGCSPGSGSGPGPGLGPGGDAAPAPAAPASVPPSSAGRPSAAGPSVPAGAGEHSDSWDVSKMPDPCLEIDAAGVAEATGLSVSNGVPLDSWPPLCAFTFTGSAQEYLYVSADPRPEARADHDRQRSDSQATEAVRGIGDDAYWLPEFTALHVFSGTTHVTVKFAGSAPPGDPKGKALAIARVVLR